MESWDLKCVLGAGVTGGVCVCVFFPEVGDGVLSSREHGALCQLA